MVKTFKSDDQFVIGDKLLSSLNKRLDLSLVENRDV